jgi:hypothetical protein
MRNVDTATPSLSARIAHGWTGFWFAPGSAANLGFCRLLAVGLLFSVFEVRGWSAWEGMDEVLWLPTPLFRALDLRPLSATALTNLALACKVALLFAAAGFATRASAAIAAVSTFYLLGLRHNFGKIYYADAVVPLILAILAVARSGDRWSVDRVLARIRGRAERRTDPAEYTWPLRLVWLLTVMVFFAAGVAKHRSAGVEWILSDQLRDVLIGQYLGPVPRGWGIGLAVAEHATLCRMLAGAVFALETLSPLALVSKWARVVIVPALVVFTASLPFLFGFQFREHFALFAFWVPWNRIATMAGGAGAVGSFSKKGH